MGSGGSLKIPTGSTAAFLSDGTLTTEDGPIGKLRIVTFDDPAALSKAGDSLISAGPTAGARDVEEPRIGVGFVEASNVNLAAEMVALIQASRAFEAAVKSIRTSDEMTASLIQTQS
jgi:flagellar basal body rod protein FlgG